MRDTLAWWERLGFQSQGTDFMLNSSQRKGKKKKAKEEKAFIQDFPWPLSQNILIREPLYGDFYSSRALLSVCLFRFPNHLNKTYITAKKICGLCNSSVYFFYECCSQDGRIVGFFVWLGFKIGLIKCFRMLMFSASQTSFPVNETIAIFVLQLKRHNTTCPSKLQLMGLD